MANLTHEQGIVSYERTDLNPVPNHVLVVYKKIGGTGLKHHTTLPSGTAFKRPLLELRFEFVCYAVSQDSNLRLTFSRKLKNKDGIHYLTLHLTLHYAVLDPTVLVDKLASDPLRRLQEEVGDVVGAAVADIFWEQIRDEEFNPEIVLEKQHADDDGIQVTKMEYLNNFARSLGLDLRRIGVTRSIHQEYLAGEIAIRDAEIQEVVENVEHRKVIRSKEHEEEKQNFERAAKWKNAITDGMIDALINVARNINSPTEMQDAAVRLLEIVQGHDFSIGSATATRPAVGGDQMLRGFLPESVTNRYGGVGQLLRELFEKLDGIDCTANQRQVLLSNCLHLAAEYLRGTEGAQDQMETYRAEIGKVVAALRTRIKPEVYSFFSNITNPEEMQRYCG